MTAWYLLFFVQTMLGRLERPSQHRRLGIIGALLAIGVVGLGVYVTLNMVSRLAGWARTSNPPVNSLTWVFGLVGSSVV
jgi:hypothetical protein